MALVASSREKKQTEERSEGKKACAREWLTCGGAGASASEDKLSSTVRLLFLTVAAATAAAGFLAQPTMNPMEPTLAAASSA